MSLYDLSSELQRIDEETSGGAISYIPGNFVPTSIAMRSLAKAQQDWDIDVIDSDIEKQIKFGDKLTIKVPNEHWDDFKGRYKLNIDGTKKVNLSGLLKEAALPPVTKPTDVFDGAMEPLKKRLKVVLTKMFDKPDFKNLDRSVDNWRARFGVTKFLRSSKVLVSVETKEKDIQKLYSDILRVYLNEKGSLELLIEAIEGGDHLGTFEVFKNYSQLYGTALFSRYKKVEMVFKGYVDFTYTSGQTVTILKNPEIIDAVEEETKNKIAGQTIYPKGGIFDNKFFRNLKDIIQTYV